jgi:6-phosphogluconolactonase (cycloisomerase 2 family)
VKKGSNHLEFHRNHNSYYYFAVSFGRVKIWANKLGYELSNLGRFVTKVDKFKTSYKSGEVSISPRDGNALVHEIAKDIKAMMESKISAIKVQSSHSINYIQNVR